MAYACVLSGKACCDSVYYVLLILVLSPLACTMLYLVAKLVEVFRHTTYWVSQILLDSPPASTSDKQLLWAQCEIAGTVFLITTMLALFKMDMACC